MDLLYFGCPWSDLVNMKKIMILAIFLVGCVTSHHELVEKFDDGKIMGGVYRISSDDRTWYTRGKEKESREIASKGMENYCDGKKVKVVSEKKVVLNDPILFIIPVDVF